jgi:5'-nucleotidase
MKRKRFTILHSNDIHGDFLAEVKEGEGELIGGLALLSGYLNKVRAEEENVIYVIAGDMIQGSLIDSEYKGISTIEIMNFLSPDVVTLGNHELDYGLPHLLFLEKMANFPIVNTNLYIKKYGKRLMNPYVIINKAGFDILFTGVITEKILDALQQDSLIGTFISLEDAASEIGKICNAYKHDDIDLTITLTHIGYQSDLELAEMLDPKWGVDMIIGGHSHTILEQPAVINDILIAQAGTGTDQIGRFDIVVDDDTNSIVEWTWELIPITTKTASPDKELMAFIDTYKQKVDEKYNSVITRFNKKLTHPKREEETMLGNLFADAFAQMTQADIMFTASGSIRKKELGPLVTLGDLMACFPYDDSLIECQITGRKLREVFSHLMREENLDGEGEFYQVNRGVRAIYSVKRKLLESLQINGIDIVDDQVYSVVMQSYHFNNSETYFNLSMEEVNLIAPPKTLATSAYQVLEEWCRIHPNEGRSIEGRLIFSE